MIMSRKKLMVGAPLFAALFIFFILNIALIAGIYFLSR